MNPAGYFSVKGFQPSAYSNSNCKYDKIGKTGITAALVTTTGVTAMGFKTGSATTVLLGPAAGCLVAGSVIATGYMTQKVKNYATRYPQPKDKVERAINRLGQLHQQNRLKGLRDHVIKKYSPSRYVGGLFGTTSQGSGDLYDNLKKTSNDDAIYHLVAKYLSQKSDGSYYHNGKRLFNLILDWIDSAS